MTYREICPTCGISRDPLQARDCPVCLFRTVALPERDRAREKRCTVCGEQKPMLAFYRTRYVARNGREVNYARPACKDCHNRETAAYHSAHPEVNRRWRSKVRS